MEFRVLGRVEVVNGREAVPLGGPRQRLVLAHLLLRRNRAVSQEQLIDDVWGENPPPAARNSLQSYVSHLRTALGSDRLEGGSRGYILTVATEELDAVRFEALVRAARRHAATEPAAAIEAYDEALSLWRGRSFDDLSGEPSLQPEIAHLEEVRLVATEERIAAQLALGRHQDVVAELEELIARHPLRERLWEKLMIALYGTGRQAEALETYRRARKMLVDELGLDPSPELRRLERHILQQRPAHELGGTPLRGYRLLERIDAGAFGDVYRAFQPAVEREVAVKVIRRALANHPEFIRRFAGLDATALIEPTRLALRDTGDRAGALYAAAAAERFYDAALRLWPEGPERADLLYRRAVPVGHHFGGGDPKLLGPARDALLAAGDGDRAAEVEMLLSQSFRIQGKRQLADEHKNCATSVLGDGPPTSSRAWVLSRLAYSSYLADDLERAAKLALEAREVSEELGLEETLSDSLALQGTIRITAGDAGGVEDLERSIELSRASGALGTLARVLNSLAVAHQMLGDLELGFRLRLECAEVAERLGSESVRRWYRGVLVDHRYRRGDWEEAQRDADSFLAHVEAGDTHALAYQVFALRAELRLAKDDVTGALADAEQAVTAARALAEGQAVKFALTASAHVFALAPERKRAEALADEVLEYLRGGGSLGFAAINLPAFAGTAVRLGLREELLGALAGYHPESRWTRAVRAYLAGDFGAAAETLARAGAKPDEAEARLRAAERLASDGKRTEADAQLERALAFYRSVGAARFIREAEARLAASA